MSGVLSVSLKTRVRDPWEPAVGSDLGMIQDR